MYETPEGVRKIIFKHVKCSIVIADQINSGNVHVDVMGDIDALHFAQVMRAGINQVDRYDSILKNELLMVYIF